MSLSADYGDYADCGTKMVSGCGRRVVVIGCAAVLAVALGYAHICGIACVLDSLPSTNQRAPSGCHQHSGPLKTPEPSDSDCILHGHPTSFLLSASPSSFAVPLHGDALFPVVITGREYAPAGLSVPAGEHSPPFLLTSEPLYLRLPCLRI